MFQYIFLKICHYNLNVVWVDKCMTMSARCHC
nr:MAG TPA: hypothetical protein [Caudoviricetes sp.]